MNYNDYVQAMEHGGLIESPDSVQHYADAVRCMSNIRTLRYGKTDQYRAKEKVLGVFVDFDELIEIQNRKKDWYIKKAIETAYNRSWALSWFGEDYTFKIKLLKKLTTPTEVSFGDYEKTGGNIT